METSHSLNPEQIDEFLSTLANQHCRFVLSYFRDSSEEVASVDDLATAVSRRDSVDKKHVAIQFHHSALPKLEDAGIIDYDARTNTARYRGHSELENWYNYIEDNELEINGGDKSWHKMSMMTSEMAQCGTYTPQTKTAR